MFKRLNTGGETLSEQEIRNSSVRLLHDGAKFMRFLSELSSTSDFKLCTQTLTEEAQQQRFDQELVLRFFAFKNNRLLYTHDVGDFMTDYMEQIADPDSELTFDYEVERDIFVKTFHILAVLLEDKAFGWVNKSGTIVRGFAVYHFESFTLGVQPFLDRIDLNDPTQVTLLRQVLEDTKKDQRFIDITSGGGRNSKGALDKRITFVHDALQNAL
jgi:hypothetical protein